MLKPAIDIYAAIPEPGLGPVMAEAVGPPADMTVSEWAAKYRIISGKAAAEPGPWRNEVTPFAVEPMDAFSDPEVEEVIGCFASQIVKTEIILNVSGYYIHQEPGPMQIVMPTGKARQDFVRDRLNPLLEDTPVLAERVGDPKSRDTGNTISHKDFEGGFLDIATAQSPAELASKPIKVSLQDEIDRYEDTAEGDPCGLADKRTARFWNRKKGKFSTPGTKEDSRIWPRLLASSFGRWYVPCPHCGKHQWLKWKQVHWESELDERGKVVRDEDGHGIHYPATAVYVCEHCAAIWDDADRHKAIGLGYWRHKRPEMKRRRGYWLNCLYRPRATLAELVEAFLEAIRESSTHQTFVNTELAEPWEDTGAMADQEGLAQRAEEWAKIPAEVAVLNGSVDVQDDRLEVEITGWGRGEESWFAKHIVLTGNPATEELWETELKEVLSRTWETEDGRVLPLRAVGIDSGGHHTEQVYRFSRKYWARKWWALKGMPKGFAVPVWPGGAPSMSRKHRGGKFYGVNVDLAKKVVTDYLSITDPGPGYCHFPNGLPPQYFKQYAAERLVKGYDKRTGKPKKYWKQTAKRNEALDLRAYNYAVLCGLRAGGFDLARECDRIEAGRKQAPAPAAVARINRPGALPPGQAMPLVQDPYL